MIGSECWQLGVFRSRATQMIVILVFVLLHYVSMCVKNPKSIRFLLVLAFVTLKHHLISRL